LARLLLAHVERGLQARASLTLVAGQWLLQVVAAFVCLGASQRIAQKRGRPWIVLMGCFGALFALITFPVAASLASGEWIRQQPYAWALRWLAPAGATGFAALAWTFLFSPSLTSRRWLRLGTALLLTGLGLLFSGINVALLTGQYEAAHRLLMALGALCSQWGLAQLIGALGARLPGRSILLPASAALTVAAVWLVRAPVAVVAELLFKSPRAATWITYVAPAHHANPIHEALTRLSTDERGNEPTTPAGWALPADWNVILLVIDTLRADPFIHGTARPRHPKQRFKRRDAPFMNDLFARSFTFDRAYAGGNMTHISMPSMLRSRNAFDSDSQEGAGIATRVARLGRHTIAVVPSGLAGRHLSWNAPSLLEGFEEVHAYRRGRHNDIRELLSQALDSGKQRPFFAWIHYMSMHAPGWAEHSLAGSKGSHKSKYVKSLRWTDREIANLYGQLEKQGLVQKTAIIVTADHGEGLGDNGVEYHAGPALHEEVIRVPLAIHIPGRAGRPVPATVGNIDILPTVVGLLGGADAPSMHGTSLLPLLAGADVAPSSYYVQSFEKQRVAATRAGRKYVLDVESGAWAHYDLSKDGWGARPRFDPTLAEHQTMADQLTWLHPDLFADNLADPQTDQLLDRRLAEALPTDASPRSMFLLDLVRLDPTPQRLGWAKRAFTAARTDGLRLQILDRLYSADQAGFGPLLEAHVSQLLRTPGERAFIEQLADIEQERFAPTLVASRLQELASEQSVEWAAWLRLIASWPLPPTFTPAIVEMLTDLGARADADHTLLTYLLRAVAHFESADASTHVLRPLCARLTEHADAEVRSAAAQAVANLAAPDAEGLLRRLAGSGPKSVSIAALRGLIRLRGAGALPDIEQFGRNSSLPAIHLIDELGSPRAIPFLDRVIAQQNGAAVEEAKLVRARLRAKI
jgi:hypothetical protein